MKHFLSVVIPAYNEEKSLKAGVLEEVDGYLRGVEYPWEVLIVDDGSIDKTALLVEKFAGVHKGFRLLREPHRGKGGTVIAGMLKAKGDIVLFSDMDQATPITQLERVLPKFDQGYDIVIGSRSGRQGAPFIRKLMAYGFSALSLMVLRLPYKDTQCGFKAFTKKASQEVFRRMKIFNERMRTQGASVTAGFDLEILYLARKLRLKVAEVPVEWHHKEGTKVNPLKDSWEGFRDLIKVRLNALSGKYKIKNK